MSKNSVLEMTYSEFVDWATEYCADGVITGGFKELKRRIALVVQQEAVIFKDNQGFQK